MSDVPGNDNVKCVRVRVSGRVQGVWYRGWTQQMADALGLDGWVRNRRDGTVEALFCGDAADVDRMIDAAWRGPPAARVSDIDAADAADVNEPGFRTLPTE